MRRECPNPGQNIEFSSRSLDNFRLVIQ